MCRYRHTHYYSPIKRGCMMTMKDIIRWKSKLKKVLPAFICIFLCRSKDTEEKAMAPHSSTLAWKIPRTEERGRLQSMGLLRVGHDWATSLSLSCIGEGNGNPLHCSCLENPRDGGAWWAATSGVAQSQTQLKRLSSSSMVHCEYLG